MNHNIKNIVFKYIEMYSMYYIAQLVWAVYTVWNIALNPTPDSLKGRSFPNVFYDVRPAVSFSEPLFHPQTYSCKKTNCLICAIMSKIISYTGSIHHKHIFIFADGVGLECWTERQSELAVKREFNKIVPNPHCNSWSYTRHTDRQTDRQTGGIYFGHSKAR